MNQNIINRIEESIATKKNMLNNKELLYTLEKLSDAIAFAITNGHKLVICGNGGSASDSLHFAGEIVGRFQKERKSWPAVTLNSDVTSMTAIANDYGYNEVFARQAQGIVNNGDVFIGISTSGNSENVFRAVKTAKENGAITAALLGKDGGKIKNEVEYPIVVNSQVTARTQECHILLIHIMCELIEERLG